MALRQGTALSDLNVYKRCPQYFPVPEKQALTMFLQPNEDFRGLQGVKREKYLRVPPRPKNFNNMAQSLSKMYKNPVGVEVTIQNLNRQFARDIKQPIKLPTVSVASPDPPNRPNVLISGVDLEQVLLETAQQVQQLGADYQQQKVINAQQAAALQQAQAQGLQAEHAEQVKGQLDYQSAIHHWITKSAAVLVERYDELQADIMRIDIGRRTAPGLTPSAFFKLSKEEKVEELIRLTQEWGGNIMTAHIDPSTGLAGLDPLEAAGASESGASEPGAGAGPSTVQPESIA